jgi:CPA2 family monovalent cation:H+ antiporter-2
MIRASGPAYTQVEKRLPRKWIRSLNHMTLSHPSSSSGKSLWRSLLTAMLRNTLIYTILAAATVALMFSFAMPLMRNILHAENLKPYADAITGIFTIIFISPFLRSIVMKKNHSEEMKKLWSENRNNRLPLIFTVLVRVYIAAAFIFYIIHRVSDFGPALMITIAIVAVILMVMSRGLKQRSIRLERMFIQNLRSRDIEAQVHGHRKPLYEGHLLDRDIHIGDFEIPEGSLWTGKTLMELHLRNRFGVHVSSILRGKQRINIPSGTTIVYPGDNLQAIGSDEQLKALSDAIEEEMFSGDPEIEKREMKLRQVIITATSPFLSKTLMESGIRDKYNCMVVGLERGEKDLWQPTPEYVFMKGDIVWVVGEEDYLKEIC